MKTALFSILLTLAAIACSGDSGSDASPPYLDATVSVERRVDDLLGRMTLEEKVGQMSQYVGLEHIRGVEGNMTAEELRTSDAQGFYKDLHSSDIIELTKQGLIGSFLHVVTLEEGNMLQELALQTRLKIPLLIGIDAIHGNGLYSGATVYPAPLTLAATWDPQLVERIGRQTALEMRATGSHWSFTPNIDVARDARWGRVGETFGEDPLMVSRMGVAMIRGLQQGDFTGDQKVIASAKHIIAGSEPANGLNGSPMDVSERTLREVFIPPYKAAADEGVFTIMAAHNEINGIPSHSNKWLLTDLLRGELGFDGFVVSDWMDIERLADLHGVAESSKEAYYLTIKAGMDMHMHGPDWLDGVVELVNEGRLSEERIDDSVAKILEAKFKLGLFEKVLVDAEAAEKVLVNDEHVATALEAARKSIVLLKNDGLLPLDQSNYKRILVTGPNANNESTLGDWASDQPDENITTVYEGLKAFESGSTSIDFFDTGDYIRSMDADLVREAGVLAGNYDLTIVVVGDNSMRYRWRERTTGENMGRANIDLMGRQIELLKAINANGKPVVVILVNGRPLGIPWVVENFPAIIEAWEPGAMGGQALAEIVFGEVNPSGKLPITIPRTVGQIQIVYNHKPSQYFHKYIDEESAPLFAFGYGLSYTNFDYSDPVLKKENIRTNGTTWLSVDVTNVGDRAGDEIVQLYKRDMVSLITRPVKELIGFRRITLVAGETQTVEFEISSTQLQSLDMDLKQVVDPGMFKLMVGGSSRDQDVHSVMLEVK